jgi:hypothetical protein
LGINLSGPADWNTELPFIDVFRLSRRWISQRKGAGWGQGPELSLDAQGWVRRLDADCWAETPLCTIDDGHYPAGNYTVSYEGHGRLDFANAASIVRRQAGRLEIAVNPTRGSIWLRLQETDPADPVRHIRVVMPGFDDRAVKEPFHPAFLRRWQGMACIRFMDWMETNNSPIRRWEDRPRPDDATYTAKGVPLETMIDLSNRLAADPWFCMPHEADDDFVRQFSIMVRERLDPQRRIFIEYSNEVWNGIFRQHRYAGEQGQRLGLAEKSWEAAWRYTAHRSKQMFGIWQSVFGGTQRLVRVLATQAVSTHVSQQVLGHADAARHADALAVAPYISCNVPREGRELNASVVEKWSVEQALDHL